MSKDDTPFDDIDCYLTGVSDQLGSLIPTEGREDARQESRHTQVEEDNGRRIDDCN